jgi:hypothetical protein
MAGGLQDGCGGRDPYHHHDTETHGQVQSLSLETVVKLLHYGAKLFLKVLCHRQPIGLGRKLCHDAENPSRLGELQDGRERPEPYHHNGAKPHGQAKA